MFEKMVLQVHIKTEFRPPQRKKVVFMEKIYMYLKYIYMSMYMHACGDENNGPTLRIF